MLSIPLLEGAVFWMLLRNPCTIPKNDSEFQFNTIPDDLEGAVENSEPKFTLGDKIRYVPSLLKYMIPFFMVFLFEYFINQVRSKSRMQYYRQQMSSNAFYSITQGLLELVYFKDTWIDPKEQYHWLQVDYQIGVFISRSSVNLIQFNKIWLMTVFQFINVLIVLAEVMTFFSPTILILFALVFWEGLLGGGAYVNTFYRMSKEIPEDKRKFALGIVPMADATGIALAGMLAMPVHNALCAMPMPTRF